MRKRYSIIASAATLTALASSTDALAGSYTYQTYSYPDPTHFNYTLTSFNDQDQITGFSKFICNGSCGHDPYPNSNFILQGSSVSLLTPYIQVNGINDSGRTVGITYGNAFPGDSLGLASGGGQPDVYYGYPNYYVSSALAISNNGKVLGTYDDSQGIFVYSGGAYTSITYKGYGPPYFNDINDAGQLSGIAADGVPFIYQNGAYTERTAKSPGEPGLNDSGVLATDFFDPDLPSDLTGYSIVDVNDKGQFLGTYGAGYFIATPTAAVPEPGTMAILGFGLASSRALRARRPRRAA